MFDVLLNDEERAIRDEVRAFVKNDVDPQLIKDMDEGKIEFPYNFCPSVAKKRLLGLRFDPKWGGRGLPWTAEVAAIEEIGVLGSALACQYCLPSIVGEAISVFGTEEQKEKYLKPTLEGKKICAEALTEPRGGSDFFGATTFARKDGNKYILNGQKRFVVGSVGADYFFVYARTKKDGPGHESLSAFLVDRDFGVQVETVYGLMGTRGGGTGRIVFNDVPVPAENLVGPENGAAFIFNRMMIPERLTSAAGAIGAARAALEVAARYSTKRHAFGRPIRKFQAVSFMVANSIAKLDAARALVWTAAKHVDAGLDSRRIVSEAKKVATETQWEVVNNAMQIMGGIGYTNVYPIERLLRDGRLSLIWTGTSEIMNGLIQHEYYRELTGLTDRRDIEADVTAENPDAEKIYTD